MEAMVAQGGPEAHRAKAMLQWDRYTHTPHTPHTHTSYTHTHDRYKTTSPVV